MNAITDQKRLREIQIRTKADLIMKFTSLGVPVNTNSLQWVEKLKFDRKERLVKSIRNFLTVLKNDPVLKGNVTLPRDIRRCRNNLKRINFGVYVEKDFQTTGIPYIHLKVHLESIYGFTSFRGLKDALILILAEASEDINSDFLN